MLAYVFLNARGRLSLTDKLTPFNTGKMGVNQTKLCRELKVDIETYFVIKYFCLKRNPKRKYKTLKNLQNQQAEINKIRAQLGIPRIRYLQSLKHKLKVLRV